MKFDQLTEERCLIVPVASETNPPPNDPGVLELRPETAVVPKLGSVQFKTFLIANGVEQEVTSGLTYKSSSTTIAIIGAIGGNATGVSEGIVTISVEWQDLEAFSQLQVVESCEATVNGLMVVLDNSESMSQVMGSGYGSKLDFAKFLAMQFAGEVNITKDKVGLVTFAASATLVSALTDDNLSVKSAIGNVGFIPEETDIEAGLDLAIDTLTQAGVDRRVILLLTDGQLTDGNEPASLAQQFRSAGGVIIAVGIRAGLEAFQRLEKVANGGFFISAYNAATGQDAKTYVSGIKGYLCAGNCCPEGGMSVGMGALNYANWSNWDAIGKVDLIGNGFFDLIPGNGLFVDLVGSSKPWSGGLSSKNSFTFIAGHQYALKYKLAGNQRANVPGYKVRVIAGSLSNVVWTMDDWRQDFTDFVDTFNGNGSTGKLLFIQETIPTSDEAQSFGILLDQISLRDVTTGEILFAENFDNENSTFIPEKCPPQGYTYDYQCCYGAGCLTDPVKPQFPDPNPHEEIEVEGGAPFWISTQFHTASCAAGTTGSDVTRSATFKSYVSAADAVAKATLLAMSAAEADLNCIADPIMGDLINVDVTIINPSSKSGQAAIGNGSADVWNTWTPSGIPPGLRLLKSDGTPTKVYLDRCFVTGFPMPANALSVEIMIPFNDPMYARALSFFRDLPYEAVPEAVFFSDMELGVYEVYVYGHGDDPNQRGSFYAWAGKLVDLGSGNVGLDDGTKVAYGLKETSVIAPPLPGNYLEPAWSENAQYVKYTITIAAGMTGICVLANPSAASIAQGVPLSVMAGIQILRIS